MFSDLYKDAPSVGDVHVPGPNWRAGYKQPVPDMGDLGPGRSAEDIEAERRAKERTGTAPVSTIALKGEFTKVDDDQHMVYGWASVISKNGQPVVDTQGDMIDAAELAKFTTAFMEDARVAKMMHEGGKVGEVVHSFPLTADLAKSLGISCDSEGWIVGMKVHDPAVWKMVKDGTLKSFSVGGECQKVDA